MSSQGVHQLEPIDQPQAGPTPLAFKSDQGLPEVQALMLQLAAGRAPGGLGAIAQSHLESGGKQLRARLALASLQALGRRRESGIAWAAACELLHNATLIHDDLQDGDEMRRGQRTVWARHGQGQAINAGDLLLMLPFLAIDRLPVPAERKWLLARAVATSAEETVRGQSLEMRLLADRRLDWSSYQEAAIGKTSALLALPVLGSALIAELPEGRIERLVACFRRLGLLFQLQDDVLDCYGDKGRQVGCDLREGGVSVLVVEHLRLHPADTGWLLSILERPRSETSPQDVEAVIRRFRSGGALEAAFIRIRQIELEIMSSEALQREAALHALAAQVIDQVLQPIRHLLGSPSVQ